MSSASSRGRGAMRAPADPTARIRATVERVIAVVGRTPKGATLDWAIDVAPDLGGPHSSR